MCFVRRNHNDCVVFEEVELRMTSRSRIPFRNRKGTRCSCLRREMMKTTYFYSRVLNLTYYDDVDESIHGLDECLSVSITEIVEDLQRTSRYVGRYEEKDEVDSSHHTLRKRADYWHHYCCKHSNKMKTSMHS